MTSINQSRVGRIAQEMNRQGLSQLLVTSMSSLFYLTGRRIDPGERFMAVYITGEGRSVTFLNTLFAIPEVCGSETVLYSDSDDPMALLARYIRPGKLGVDKTWPSHFFIDLMPRVPDTVMVNGSPVVDLVRMVKDQEEQELMRRASRINDQAVAMAIGMISPELTELELSRATTEAYAKLHVKNLRNTPIVAYGAHCAEPHHGPDDTRLQPGDNVLFDIGKSVDGYNCDMTRTVAYRSAGDLQRKIYQIVLEANLAGIAAVRPGVRCCDVDCAARAVIEKAGYGEYFTHRTGHNIGIDVHEFPDIGPRCEIEIVPGMIFSIEPGIYLPGSVGVRIEDLVLVTENGCENLNAYPKELQIVE
ncbi:MAG: Xaa-Pro peptidase family protein [Oscillospiraceae bacterium]|nr:Xaa-Pro peptidase family protein [Oscillospiraceae bacterium]